MASSSPPSGSPPSGSPPSNTPILSIIIPVWNRAETIRACLASIVAPPSDAMAWELVVVDDGSTDGSPQAIRDAFRDLGLEARARLIEQANAGPGVARNTAIAAARGHFIACLDSDDLWLDWTLPTILDLLRAEDAPDVAFLQQDAFADGAPLPPVEQAPRKVVRYRNYLDAFLAEGTGTMFGGCNLVARRALLQEIGGFPAELRCYEDIDLFLRLPLELKMDVALQPVLFRYRNTPGSLTSSFDAARTGLSVLRQSEADGRYPGGPGGVRARTIFLARVAQWTVMNGWLNKRYAASYGLFLRSIPEFALNRCRRFLIRYHQHIVRHIIKRSIGRADTTD